jgi:quinol monooxygenase YgiN
MITVTNIAFVRAKSGFGDELGRRLTDLVEPSREEAGCAADFWRYNNH